MAHIGIIGAGISGLTLGFLLRKRGHRIRIFEASDQPGGAIKTTRDPDGWMAEWGPNTIIESSGRIKRLVAMLDLEGHRIYPDNLAKKRYIVRDRKAMAVPVTLRELITTPLLSRQAKFRVLREPFRRKHTGNPDESLADFVRRRLGEEFLKWPIDALVGGIYAGDAEALSVRHAFPRLALLEKQHGSLILGQLKGGVKRPPESDEIPRNKADIFSFDQGLQLLTDTLCERLGNAVSLGRPVAGISVTEENKSSHRWKITPAHPVDPTETCDTLIYAGTSCGLSQIRFPEKIQTLLKPLDDITYPPLVSLTLGFRRKDVSHPLDGFGMLVPGIERFPILGTLFTSSLFPNRAPDKSHVTLTTYLGGMRQPEITVKEESEQIRMVIETLGELLGVTGEPRFCHRILWSKAIPQYEMGYEKFLDQMDRTEQEHPGFYLAGNFRTGISVGDTINAAFDLADRIIKQL